MKSSCLPIVAIVELELFQHDILRFAIVNIYHSFTIVAMINQQSPRNMDRFMGVAFGSMLGTITIGTCGSLLGIPGCRNHGVCPWGLPMGFAHGFAHGKTMAKSRISDVSGDFQWKTNQKKRSIDIGSGWHVLNGRCHGDLGSYWNFVSGTSVSFKRGLVWHIGTFLFACMCFHVYHVFLVPPRVLVLGLIPGDL